MAEPTMQQRIAEAVRRRCVGPCGLTPDEARVLAAIVTRAADRSPMPSQEVLASEIGLSRRTLSFCVSRLGRLHGFVFAQRGGRQAAVYHVGWLELEGWAEAELRCAGNGFDAQEVRNEAEKQPDARARGNSSSSSSSVSTPASSPEAYDQHLAMCTAVRRCLTKGLSPEAKDVIWGWVGRYSVAQVQAACRKMARSPGQSVGYVEAIILEDEVKAKFNDDDDQVVEFEAYRGLPPWKGA